ncbi:MAG: hypothetical protein M3534_06460, partial [Actinomycetota bacterium]|nr:hypothetical protein [Actinomycetota bacterium]
ASGAKFSGWPPMIAIASGRPSSAALEMNERMSRLSVTRSDAERGAVEGMLAQLIDGQIR